MMITVACSTDSNNSLPKEKKVENVNEQEKEDEVEKSSNDGFIELRNESLWLSKKELNTLVLDGERYSIDKKVLNMSDSSHVKITYPLIILGGELVYDLEKNQEVITLDKIVNKLQKVWGKKVATDGYIWYGETLLEPENFTFIDHVQYSDNKGKMSLSMHSFMADMFDSIVCTYDLKNNTIKFIADPFKGQVSDIEFSREGNNLAYSYIRMGDYLDYYIDIVAFETMEIIQKKNIYELILTGKYADLDKRDVHLMKIYWEDDELIAEIEIPMKDKSRSKKIKFKVTVWSKE